MFILDMETVRSFMAFPCSKGGNGHSFGRAIRFRQIYACQADRPFLGCRCRCGFGRRHRCPGTFLSDLTEKISFVSQDNFLFNMSLRDNIRIGKPDATDKEVEWAAAQAGCDEFIARFPKGYDTNAGDAGARLSGGERQRLAIARAILKNAPIVILTRQLPSQTRKMKINCSIPLIS